mgnify:CR=1 FL=1
MRGSDENDDPVDERPDSEREPADQQLRYAEADVAEVEAVDSESAEEEPSGFAWYWWVVIGVVAVALIAFGVILIHNRRD